jgi:hypothetical protein
MLFNDYVALTMFNMVYIKSFKLNMKTIFFNLLFFLEIKNKHLHCYHSLKIIESYNMNNYNMNCSFKLHEIH